MHHASRPSLRAYFTNLRQPMPLPRKVFLLIRNAGRRITTMSNCCGHPGQPGC